MLDRILIRLFFVIWLFLGFMAYQSLFGSMISDDIPNYHRFGTVVSFILSTLGFINSLVIVSKSQNRSCS